MIQLIDWLDIQLGNRSRTWKRWKSPAYSKRIDQRWNRSIEIVVFSSLWVLWFKENDSPEIMNDRFLKSTKTIKVSKNDHVAIFVTDEELSAFYCEKL